MSAWLQVRRHLDRIAAAVLLIPLTPVICVLALAVWLSDGRPALIRVPRVGRSGVEFGMWKIRSMRAESPDGLSVGSSLTAAEDDRITPMGRRLRRLRLDELPQLLNVAGGQMLLLGPRPEAPAFVDLSDERWSSILRCAPGIAGATQILVNRWEAEVLAATDAASVYRGKVLPVKLAVDGWYVRSASPRLDALVLRSLALTLAGRATPALRSAAAREMPEVELPGV